MWRKSIAGAVERIRRLQDFELIWVDEPVAAEDLVALVGPGALV